MRRLGAFILLLSAVLVPVACSDEDGGPGPAPIVPDPYPDATTADILVDNFVRAYEEMNFAEYTKLIHPEFQFFFWEEDIVRLGLDSPGWDRVAELGTTQNIFEGRAGITVDGDPVPGVVKIAMTKWDDTVAEWLPAQGEPLYDGTSVRSYRFNIDLTYDGVSTPVQAHGIERFYVTQVEVDGQQVFQLKFWVDLGTDVRGNKAGVERSSWGSIKSMHQ